MAEKTNKSIITLPSTVVQPQFKVNFNDNPFNDAILQKGYNIVHEKSLRCPCVNRQNGAANPSCQNCGGSGHFYVEAKRTKALVQGVNVSTKQENWTEVTPGQARITMRGEDAPTYNDIIRVLDLKTYFSQIVYPVFADGKLYAFSIYEILEIDMAYIWVADDVPLRMLRGYRPQMADLDWDFKVAGNVVNFNPLTMDTTLDYNVSIRYKHHPVYYVTDLEREVFLTEVAPNCGGVEGELKPMPVRCKGIRAHYLPANANATGPRYYDNTDYSKFKPDEYQPGF